MSKPLTKGWLRRFLGSDAQDGEIQIFNQEGVEIGQSLRALEQANAEQAALIGQLNHQLRLATAAQSALAKRAQKLADDWPDLYKRYFTELGDADREAGRRTKTKRKAKRRTA